MPMEIPPFVSDVPIFLHGFHGFRVGISSRDLSRIFFPTTFPFSGLLAEI